MKDAYSQLALNYDSFMEEVPYEKWADFIEQIWDKFNIKKPESMLDLCCGTGAMTVLMQEKGYSMHGLDFSCEMLAQASKKVAEKDMKIPFYNMDMMEFELPESVDCVICCCDGLNYAIDDGDLEDTFACVNNSLNENGIFIFDLNTEYKFKEVLGNKQYSSVEENSAYFWQNEYNDEEKVNTYYVSLFEKVKGDMYERVEEYHYERAYDIEEVREILSVNGFEILGIFDDYRFSDVKNNCERYTVLARKVKK